MSCYLRGGISFVIYNAFLLRCGTRSNDWAPNETQTHSWRFADYYTTRGAQVMFDWSFTQDVIY